MSKEYKGNCMKFSNSEIKNYMIEYLINNGLDNSLIRYLSEDGEEIDINSSQKIGTIVFDGMKENLFINFYDIHTSIFVHDIEIMFIDEDSKGMYTSSDVYNNVVYEGKLRQMSHEEMLQMFAEIIYDFTNVSSVSMIQTDMPENEKYQRYNYYVPHFFTINVEGVPTSKKSKVYENILIQF